TRVWSRCPAWRTTSHIRSARSPALMEYPTSARTCHRCKRYIDVATVQPAMEAGWTEAVTGGVPLFAGSRMAIAPRYDPALHYKGSVAQGCRLREGVSGDCDDIGVAAWLDRADLVRPSQQVSGVARGCEDGVHRFHPVRDQQVELHRVIAFADVGAIGDLDARLNGERQGLLGQQV